MNPTRINTVFGTFMVPDLNDVITTRLIEGKVIDPWVMDRIIALAPLNSWVVDVGAYYGDLLIPIADRRPDLQFIAFEVNQKIVDLLYDNLRLHDLLNRVIVRCAAVYDGSCATICLPPVDGQISGGVNYAAFGVDPKRTDGQMVTTVTLDDVLKDTDGISVLKIDAQGSDLAVMRGAQQVIKRTRPAILFEYEQGVTGVENGHDYAPLRYPWPVYQQVIDALDYHVADHQYDNYLLLPNS